MDGKEARIGVARPRRIEWPTLALLAAVHGAFLVLTGTEGLPVWAVVPALALVLAMHASLQHEIIHGHPFPSRFWSQACGLVPMGLAVPFHRFRDTHLDHHFDALLTDPYDDPESNYLDAATLSRLPAMLRWLLVANNTLAGRMVLGPAIGTLAFWHNDARRMARGERDVVTAWAMHAACLAPLLAWIAWAPVSWSAYLAAAYLSMSLIKVRTFAEHQAHERARGRSVIVEGGGPWSWLFLNNNLHAVHHAFPKVAWYDLPALHRTRREEFARRNGGYRFQGYGALFGRHLWRAKDPVAHPIWTRANRRLPLGLRPRDAMLAMGQGPAPVDSGPPREGL